MQILKAGCVGIYAAGALAGLLPLPEPVPMILQYVALFVLVAHCLETLLFWRLISSYRGPIATSIALGILFGMLHLLELNWSRKAAMEVAADGEQ